MKKNKELINEIVDRLKAKEDFPYRKGAWERFKEFENPAVSGSGKIRHLGKYMSAAAMLLMGFVVSYFVWINKKDINGQLDDSAGAIAAQQQADSPTVEKDKSLPKVLEPVTDSYYAGAASTAPAAAVQHTALNIEYLKGSSLQLDRAFYEHQLVGMKPVFNNAPVMGPNLSTLVSLDKSNPTIPLIDHFVLANTALGTNVGTNSTIEKNMGPKSFKFNEKFDLGLYVSPYTASENLKIGAGLTVAYNLSSKISIRTGASYNTYEVGILKNPNEASSVEQVIARVPSSAPLDFLSSANNLVNTKLALPNINAVTGFVQSVEIPLEVKYNLNRTMYAVAGVSYSTIINQERNAQYVENVNYNTFSNGFPTNQQEASKALEVVTKTIKSAEQNVNTNGYNGFVNFSIGKKVNIHKKVNLSIEPYYKVSVGQFRNADMNYSNGGVRIMTNF